MTGKLLSSENSAFPIPRTNHSVLPKGKNLVPSSQDIDSFREGPAIIHQVIPSIIHRGEWLQGAEGNRRYCPQLSSESLQALRAYQQTSDQEPVIGWILDRFI